MLDRPALSALVRDSTDDKALLGLLTTEAEAAEAYAAHVRSVRDGIALRLHNLGVPTTVIARAARLTDSYLARRVFAAGGQRKITRRSKA